MLNNLPKRMAVGSASSVEASIQGVYYDRSKSTKSAGDPFPVFIIGLLILMRLWRRREVRPLSAIM